jgi:hypothetical protein
MEHFRLRCHAFCLPAPQVDFKIRTIELEGKTVKLQIVRCCIILSSQLYECKSDLF